MSDRRRTREMDESSAASHDADRRALLKAGGVLLGASLLPLPLASCGGSGASDEQPSRKFAVDIPNPQSTRMATAADEAVLAVVADAIFPTTADSPGAIAAGVPPVVTRILNDCWNEKSRGHLLSGLDTFLANCRTRHGKHFLELAPEVRLALLAEEDAAATPMQLVHWFHFAYDVISKAYWSSEAGATKALRWIPVPGRWVGCTKLEPGQPAWG